uniref:Uncharacterized protein n=1 Tax=Oryza meridionalis TaxID=40149 RepID=A0A0E0BWZ5_9ORYZ
MVTTRSMAVSEKMMKRKRLSPVSAAMTEELALYHDNVVHIACLVAATSPEPIANLLSLPARPCTAAVKECDVGRRVPLERLDNMKWVENERYLAIVNHLVAAGNPDAGFIIGVTLAFAQTWHRAFSSLTRPPLRATRRRPTGKKYISQVEGDGDEAATTVAENKRTNRKCQRCRKIAEDAVQEVMWKVVERRGQLLVLPEDNHQCTATGCGLELGWEGYEGFCSDGCRIKHEYSKFFTEVMKYLP